VGKPVEPPISGEDGRDQAPPEPPEPVARERIRVHLDHESVDGCPTCGSPFRSEVRIGSRLEVVCLRNHRFEVVAVQRSVAHDDRYELAEPNN